MMHNNQIIILHTLVTDPTTHQDGINVNSIVILMYTYNNKQLPIDPKFHKQHANSK